jgi:hypothetical protein|tara:strand:- start:25 stop:195 length:171 start_codon:yes stop_codon:yes gene_type:complete
MATYKLHKSIWTGEVNSVTLTKDDGSGINIPFAEGNKHYQEYLDWVAKGNTAEAAD